MSGRCSNRPRRSTDRDPVCPQIKCSRRALGHFVRQLYLKMPVSWRLHFSPPLIVTKPERDDWASSGVKRAQIQQLRRCSTRAPAGRFACKQRRVKSYPEVSDVAGSGTGSVRRTGGRGPIEVVSVTEPAGCGRMCFGDRSSACSGSIVQGDRNSNGNQFQLAASKLYLNVKHSVGSRQMSRAIRRYKSNPIA